MHQRQESFGWDRFTIVVGRGDPARSMVAVMTNRPPLAHLHRCDGARNMARFYRLHLERTLFGEWALVRTFGRIGTRGRSLALVFPTRAAALLAFERQRAAKLKRGYGPA